MSDELKAMLRQAPMNGFAIRTLAYIEKLEAQLAARCSAVSAQPVAWIVISEETDNTRIWWRDKERADAWCAKHDKTAIALYAAPPSTHTEPQTAGAESHSPTAMEGEKDTIVNLIHEHVGFEVLLAIESGVLTGVEDAAEAILAELGRRSQAVSAQHRYDQDGQTCPTCGRVGNSEG